MTGCRHCPVLITRKVGLSLGTSAAPAVGTVRSFIISRSPEGVCDQSAPDSPAHFNSHTNVSKALARSAICCKSSAHQVFPGDGAVFTMLVPRLPLNSHRLQCLLKLGHRTFAS